VTVLYEARVLDIAAGSRPTCCAHLANIAKREDVEQSGKRSASSPARPKLGAPIAVAVRTQRSRMPQGRCAQTPCGQMLALPTAPG